MDSLLDSNESVVMLMDFQQRVLQALSGLDAWKGRRRLDFRLCRNDARRSRFAGRRIRSDGAGFLQ